MPLKKEKLGFGFQVILVRSLFIGLATGLLMGAYVLAVVEPVLDQAIAYENAAVDNSAGSLGREIPGQSDESEPRFTRVQQKVGGFIANVVYAFIVAGSFGTVYAAVRHRIPAQSESGRVYWLAAVAFVTMSLVPFIKYPPNPPGGGDPETVGQRTVQYALIVVIGVLVGIAFGYLNNRLRPRMSAPVRYGVSAIVSVIAAVVVFVVMPATAGQLAPSVPAELIWQFRVRSFGDVVVMWLGIGLGLGWALQGAAGRLESQKGEGLAIQ